MAHPQTVGNESPGSCLPAEDAGTQTTHRDFNLLGNTQDASNQTAHEDFVQLKSIQDASTQISEDDFSSLKEFNSKEVNWTIPSETSEENRKRRATSVQMIGFDTDVQKRSRPDICGMSDQDISILREKGFRNMESTKKVVSTPSQDALHASYLKGIKQEVLDPEEPNSPNQELDALDYLGKTENLTTEQNTASNIFQKENAACQMTDPKASEVKKVFLADVMNVTRSPLWSRENISQSYLCPEKFQNRSPLKLQFLVESDQTPSTCLGCNKTISEHLETHDGKNMYRCCQCLFKSDNENCLLTHIYHHEIKFWYCKACKLNYSHVSLHGRGQTCDVCKIYFECKYQLEDHYFMHEEFHDFYCRICRKEIYKHYTNSEGVKQYKCCFSECKFRSNKKRDLKIHLYRHSDLKLFRCEICGKRFVEILGVRNHLRNTHPLCELCGKRFINSYLLNGHLFEEHGKK